MSEKMAHHFVGRQCLGDSEEELHFNIGGRTHAFGKKDFALMTRLNCGTLPTIKDVKSLIKEKFFSDLK